MVVGGARGRGRKMEGVDGGELTEDTKGEVDENIRANRFSPLIGGSGGNILFGEG